MDGVFTVDFEKGYDIPELTSLKRAFKFTDSSISLRDEFAYDGTLDSFTERFVSTVKPKFENGEIILDSLALRPKDNGVIEKTTVTEVMYGTTPYYCIDFILQTDSRMFELNIIVL